MACSYSVRVRSVLGVGLLALVGCTDAPVIVGHPAGREIPITPATLDSLPALATTPGETLCPGTAADSLCPRLTASANWLAPDVFAYWEFNRPIRLVRQGLTTTFVSADPARSYVATLGVGPGPMSGGVTVIDPVEGAALQFDGYGQPIGHLTLPPVSSLHAWNFSGPVAYLQTMVPSTADSTIDLVVRTATLPGADDAKERFRINLPWLRMVDGQTITPPPLFPNAAVFGFDGAGNAVWSDGAHFQIRQTTPAGRTIWALLGDFTGPAVDSIDMDWKIGQIRQPTLAEPVPEWQIEAMRSITGGTRHPAITALHVSPDGWTLVAGANLPQQSAVPYYRLGPDGTLKDRVEIPRERQVVLFAGDSILLFQRAADPAQAGTLAWERLVRTP